MIEVNTSSKASQCLTSSFASKIDAKFKDVALDLLTVIANKPVNFNGLKQYSSQDLWETALNYAAIRHVGRPESDIRICIRKIESIFEDCHVDIISLEGLAASLSASTPGSAYYAREKELQKIVLEEFQEQLHSSINSLVQSNRTREVEVLKTWMAILWSRNANGPKIIPLQSERLAHYYQMEFGKDMPVASIDYSTVIEILANARLAYPVDNDSDDSASLCPIWLTDRDWLGTIKARFDKEEA